MGILLVFLLAGGLLFSVHQMYKHRHLYSENPRLKIIYSLLLAFWLALIAYIYSGNQIFVMLSFGFLIAHWLMRGYSTKKNITELKSTLDTLSIEPIEEKNSVIPEKYTALTNACVNGDLRIVKELISSGVDIEDTNDEWTPLMHAISNSREEIGLYLIEAGADVNAKETGIREENAMSPISLAIEEPLIRVAELLLEKGADPTLFAPENYTLGDFAEENGHSEMVELLGRYGHWPTSMLDDDGNKI